jgi:hypothetical protein
MEDQYNAAAQGSGENTRPLRTTRESADHYAATLKDYGALPSS